jgi:hypothetical protein
MSRKPISVKIIDEKGLRICVTTYDGGRVVRTSVDPAQKPKKKPRLRRQLLKGFDHTRKRQF